MKAYRCSSCRFTTVIERSRCPVCSSVMNQLETEIHGTVLYITTLYSVPAGFKEPVIIAIAEIDDGMKVLGNILDGSVSEGDRVVVEERDGKVVFRKI